MVSFKRNLQSLAWYARRPQYYGELIHALKSTVRDSFSKSKDREIQQATKTWCRQMAIPLTTALKQITGKTELISLRQTHPIIFQQALDNEKQCPIKMGGGADQDLLYTLSLHCHAQKILETGVAYGWSSLALLLALQDRENGLLISTDKPYPGLNNELYVGCVVPENIRHKWKLIRLADRQAVPQALQELDQIDFCHYDSDKSYPGRMHTYPLLWRSLRKDGIFVSDDIGDNFAFRDFCLKVEATPLIIEDKGRFVGIIVKK